MVIFSSHWLKFVDMGLTKADHSMTKIVDFSSRYFHPYVSTQEPNCCNYLLNVVLILAQRVNFKA